MPEETTQGFRILIVDDEELIAQELSEYLCQFGFEASYISNGGNALNCIKRSPPLDAVIVDLRIPNVSGFEIIEAARKFLSEKSLIISISGHATEEDITKSYTMGADRFFRKPYRASELVSLLKDTTLT